MPSYFYCGFSTSTFEPHFEGISHFFRRNQFLVAHVAFTCKRAVTKLIKYHREHLSSTRPLRLKNRLFSANLDFYCDSTSIGWRYEKVADLWRDFLIPRLFNMGRIAKSLYISRSLYHTGTVSRPWQHNLRTAFQRCFQVRSSSWAHSRLEFEFWSARESYFRFMLACFVYFVPK